MKAKIILMGMWALAFLPGPIAYLLAVPACAVLPHVEVFRSTFIIGVVTSALFLGCSIWRAAPTEWRWRHLIVTVLALFVLEILIPSNVEKFLIVANLIALLGPFLFERVRIPCPSLLSFFLASFVVYPAFYFLVYQSMGVMHACVVQ